MEAEFRKDIDAIQGIAAVPTILEVVCRTTGMGFAAVARVTEERWIACSVLDNIDFGLKPGGELKVETTICNEIRASHEAVVIDHVSEDEAFCGHPTPAMYGFQSYISMPIVLPDGEFFGTLCAIDPKPRGVKRVEVVGMFKLFAELIAHHLNAERKLASSESLLLDERRTSELREQFIAVLGHDLRNPLGSIAAGTNLLMRQPLDENAQGIVRLMQSSVVRMKGLVDNVLDFARGRLGGGLPIQPELAEIAPVLWQAIAEMQSIWPERAIEAKLDVSAPVRFDASRMAQLFSNLLANALTHGAAGEPVRIDARIDGGSFVLSVANSGNPIPAAAMQRLFQPFYRSEAKTSPQGLGQGLGLGLYIASEIARAHGGRLEVASSLQETRFTFTMPA